MVIYREMQCVAACNKIKGKMPYQWDLNIYRGCEHGCKYCFAIYSHDYLESSGYFNEIFVKTNIVDRLECLLSSPRWKKEIINIGGVTDSYQPAEKTYKIMPDILRLMIKYRNPCIISTKSDLILRDFDLIDELSRLTYVNIVSTITCAKDVLRSKIEPNGVSTPRRFAMLKAFAKTKASRGVHIMPIIPYITDNAENIDCLYSRSSEIGVDYVLPGILNLRGKTRTTFFDFVRQQFPYLERPISELYKTGHVDKAYKTELYIKIGEIRRKYNMSGNYAKNIKQKLSKEEGSQLTLLDML